MKRITIKDLSRETGLSVGVISKYLNGKHVLDETAMQIKSAIDKTGYRIDEYARRLVTNETHIIGMLLPELDNLFYSSIAAKVDERLNKEGYTLLIRESRYDFEREKTCVEWFALRRVDALIIVPNGKSANDYSEINKLRIPIVFFDLFVDGAEGDFVLVNNREIAYEGVSALIREGHKKIAFIGSQRNEYTSSLRLQGFRDAFEKNNIPFKTSFIYRIDTLEKAYDVARKAIEKGKCTAIFAANYYCTLGAMFAFNEMGISIPSEMSFLGFDNLLLSEIFRPKPAIIHQPIELIAETIARRALEIIDGKEYETTILPCEFISGETISKPRKF